MLKYNIIAVAVLHLWTFLIRHIFYNLWFLFQFWDSSCHLIFFGFQVDTGFWIWSFQGKILKRLNIETFCGLQWRPRLPTLLSQKQQQEIRKNLKKYSAQFESKDRMRLSRASKVSSRNLYAYGVGNLEKVLTYHLLGVSVSVWT
jgi:hypothetical protein